MAHSTIGLERSTGPGPITSDAGQGSPAVSAPLVQRKIQRRVIQRVTSATPNSGASARASDNGARLESFETLADSEKNKGKSEFAKVHSGVRVANGKSMAKDPQFESWAKTFEMSFGTGAMSDSHALGAAQAMCDRIIDILVADYNTMKKAEVATLQKTDPAVQTLVGKACGLDASAETAGVAGAVARDKVMEHMGVEGGNLRTKMTAVFNFGRPFQAKIEALNKADKLDAFLGHLGGEVVALKARAKVMKEQPGARLTTNPTTGAVKDQAKSRGEFEHKDAHQSIRTAEHVDAHQDELSFMGLEDQSQRLKWEEGARKWQINENDTWVQTIRELSLPIKAGPSGTTDRIMQTRTLLGVSTAVDGRASCIGYLLPINAHSLVEIMEGAAPHGLPFTPGVAMYKSIDPFGSLQKYSPDPRFWQAVNGEDE
jgi:hypothetical protein